MSEPTDDLAEADERPWEEPGSCRMDCAPHRAGFLTLCGLLSLLFGIATFPVSGVFLSRRANKTWALLLLVYVLAWAVSIATWAAARRDLKKMAGGVMDPAGRTGTSIGRDFAFAATVMTGLITVVVIGEWVRMASP